MSDVAIRVEKLSKQYRIGRRERYGTLRDTLTDAVSAPFRYLRKALRPGSNGAQPPSDLIWALKDVSFEVPRGAVLGVIGKNGAGKSTLLKILSRITDPTEGHVQIRGRVGSLLEVGTGFHGELSGRENIFLNGAILGMRRAEIARKFDEIVAFAEVEKFIDTPVKHYSSGMYMRLAFAVAAHLEPEILVIDEVLAVGDTGFQNKCLGKVDEVARQGRTVLFVSHNMSAVKMLTERSLWMDGGVIRMDDSTGAVVQNYLSTFESVPQTGANIRSHRRDRYSSSPVQVVGVWANDSSGHMPVLDMGESFVLAIEVDTRIEIRGAEVDFELKKTDGTRVAQVVSVDSGFRLYAAQGRHVVRCEVKGLLLTPGQYLVDVGINESTSCKAWDVILNFPVFAVVDRTRVLDWQDRPWGAVHCEDLTWQMTTVNTPETLGVAR